MILIFLFDMVLIAAMVIQETMLECGRNRFQVSSAIVKWIVDGRRYLARIQL